jgi:nitrogen regulatory protein PII
MLKLVTAVIKPQMLDPVKEALQGASITGMTVTEVRGFGRQAGHTETYRGVEYMVDFVPKLKIEVICATRDVEKVAQLIRNSAQTGKIGDGKIWVLDLDAVMRVRTGEVGADAI